MPPPDRRYATPKSLTPRCLIRIRPERLCTSTARDLVTISWEEERAMSDYRPDFVSDWLIR